MLVKSMARKSPSFAQLLRYINAPEQKGEPWLQNFRATTLDLDRLHGELLANARLLAKRKNGNVLYHEVLSFSRFDRSQITTAMLEDMTRHYLALRAPYALAYAQAHLDTYHPHVHILLSANNVGSSSRLRLTKAQFRQIHAALEAYQQARYPELTSSLVLREKRTKKPRRRRTESERDRRLKQEGRSEPTAKERVRNDFLAALSASYSRAELEVQLAKRGLRLRERGRTATLLDEGSGRRYRPATLGIDETLNDNEKRWCRLTKPPHGILRVALHSRNNRELDP